MNPLARPLFVVLLAVAPAAAQDPTQHRQGQRQSTGFVLEAGEHEIQDLVDDAALYLGRNILTHAQDMQTAANFGTTVRLHKRIEVDALGCEELLSHLLYVKGLALVPMDEEKGFWEVISFHGPRRAEIQNRALWKSPEEILRRPNLKIAVLTSVPIEHINATVATNSLRPFFASAGTPQGGGLTLGNVGNNSALLLQGYADQVAAAIRMLREVDKPLAERDPQMNEVVKEVQSLQAQVHRLRAELDLLKKGKSGQ